MKLKGAFPAVKADIVLDDKSFSLKEYGIPGKILYTPGHGKSFPVEKILKYLN